MFLPPRGVIRPQKSWAFWPALEFAEMKRIIVQLVALVAAVRGRLKAVTGKGDPIQARLRRYASPQDPVMARLIRYCG
jgi:hypothetical protein